MLHHFLYSCVAGWEINDSSKAITGQFHEKLYKAPSTIRSSQKCTELKSIPTIKIGKPYNGSHKVCLPSLFLEILNLTAGDRLKVELKGNSMIMTPIASPSGKTVDATGAEPNTPQISGGQHV